MPSIRPDVLRVKMLHQLKAMGPVELVEMSCFDGQREVQVGVGLCIHLAVVDELEDFVSSMRRSVVVIYGEVGGFDGPATIAVVVICLMLV